MIADMNHALISNFDDSVFWREDQKGCREEMDEQQVTPAKRVLEVC